METYVFESLIEGLVKEHKRLRGTIDELSRENQRLRSELIDLCSGAISSCGDGPTHSPQNATGPRLEVLPGDMPVTMDDKSDGSIPRVQGGLRKSVRNEQLCIGAGSDGVYSKGLESPAARVRVVESVAASEAQPLEDGSRKHASNVGASSSGPDEERQRRRCDSVPTGRSFGTSASVLFRSASMGMGLLPPEWPEWTKAQCDDNALSIVSTTSPLRCNHDTVKAKSGGRLVDEKGYCSRFVLHPGCTARTVWDLFSSLIIGYDLVYIPFDLGGFELPDAEGIFEVIDRCTACFWVLDIFMSFFTGYHTGGLVEMRADKIARAYAKGWLGFDLFVVTMDWVFIFLGGTTVLRIGKSKRLLRLIRTLRLVRSVKMTVKLAHLMDDLRSEGLRILLHTMSLALCILTLNHYFACGWYYVGTSGDPDNNWVARNVLDDRVGMRYATALHWSFTQFTPAGMEIHPSNVSERVYTVITVFFAMITFSSFTGSITANMTALRRLQSEPAAQQKILHDYFTQHGISAELGTRIWGYLKKNHFEHRRKVLRKDIAVLKFLPPSISRDLNEELYVPIVKHSPFFFHYGIVNFRGLCTLCDSVITESALTLGERLFHSGTIAEHMYFVTLGSMQYEHRDPRLCTNLERYEWVSEPVLWMKWYYCGYLEAITSCQVVGVNSQKLRSVISEQPRAKIFVRNYVQGVRDWMILCDANEANTWKTDVWLQVAQLREIATDALPDHDQVEESRSAPRFWQSSTVSETRRSI
mmetsp:Transcript_46109/g.132849  ORF Transcript_46109/g.132849 Transcript_46109/m.132849 type:complete len:756 (+) Transcript_46109:80-2347(+)